MDGWMDWWMDVWMTELNGWMDEMIMIMDEWCCHFAKNWCGSFEAVLQESTR
jgi:hypothetical protein